jgi:hypothetical protein
VRIERRLDREADLAAVRALGLANRRSMAVRTVGVNA